MIDDNLLIKQAVDTGEVIIGARRTEKAVKKKVAKLVVTASNCPTYPWLIKSGVKTYRFKGDSLSLGSACGKPFPVSILTIIDPGESGILSR